MSGAGSVFQSECLGEMSTRRQAEQTKQEKLSPLVEGAVEVSSCARSAEAGSAAGALYPHAGRSGRRVLTPVLCAPRALRPSLQPSAQGASCAPSLVTPAPVLPLFSLGHHTGVRAPDAGCRLVCAPNVLFAFLSDI